MGLDAGAQGEGRFEGPAFGGEAVDQPVAGRVGGGQGRRGQEHLHGHVVREPAGQADRPAFGGDEPAGHLGQGEERGVGRSDQVAGEGQLEAPGDGGTLDGGDQRLAQPGTGQPGQPPFGDDGHAFGGEGLEVHP